MRYHVSQSSPRERGVVLGTGDHPVLAGGLPRASGGWSGRGHHRRDPRRVFPARAGVVPVGGEAPEHTCRLPRASGGGPGRRSLSGRSTTSSPRERGRSAGNHLTHLGIRVFPARAGVVPGTRRGRATGCGLPRASGGGPVTVRVVPDDAVSSPRERGWSGDRPDRAHRPRVFPARAGVVRRPPRPRSPPARLPRASGGGPPHFPARLVAHRSSPRERGGPPSRVASARHSASSPRERGWSGAGVRARLDHHVFPARAGVVRPCPPSAPVRQGLPRASGVVPVSCTAPSTAGGLPRASGGGPSMSIEWAMLSESSPRERGWSRPHGRVQPPPGESSPRERGWSFSPPPPRGGGLRLPRASGGGPGPRRCSPACAPSSPRERGWSVKDAAQQYADLVFPARAGVVPRLATRPGRRLRLPRASGGGPGVQTGWASSFQSSPRERGGGPALPSSVRWPTGSSPREPGGPVVPAVEAIKIKSFGSAGTSPRRHGLMACHSPGGSARPARPSSPAADTWAYGLISESRERRPDAGSRCDGGAQPVRHVLVDGREKLQFSGVGRWGRRGAETRLVLAVVLDRVVARTVEPVGGVQPRAAPRAAIPARSRVNRSRASSCAASAPCRCHCSDR